MSLMELIIKVAKIKSRDLVILMINTMLIILFYYLLFENSEIIYPLSLSLFFISIYFCCEVISYKRFVEKLSDSKKSPNYQNSNVSVLEGEILSCIREIHEDYLNKIQTLNQQIAERETLFSQWIHNMKTSITVIDLACETSRLSGTTHQWVTDIYEENQLLEKNLEQCLNVLRLDDFSRDYVTGHYHLRELMNTVINAKKRDFIYKGVFPKVNIRDDLKVYTDKKWCLYLLDQLISNAIKYSVNPDNPIIEISSVEVGEIVRLSIRDYGIGISKEDLPRVFEPFFTGSNGRTERSATGIGLYLVKIISSKLGHPVQIQSELNNGTEVFVNFHSEKDFY